MMDNFLASGGNLEEFLEQVLLRTLLGCSVVKCKEMYYFIHLILVS